MLFSNIPKTGLGSSAFHFLFYFSAHIVLYACNIADIESLVAPFSFIAALFNISTSAHQDFFFVSLAKKKRVSRVVCLVSSVAVFLLILSRVLYQAIFSELPAFSLKVLVLKVVSVLAFWLANLLFCFQTKKGQLKIQIYSDNLNDLRIKLKKFDQGTDFCMILVCLLLIIFAEIKFTHLLTILIVIALMVQEDFQSKLEKKNQLKFRIYSFFLKFVCLVLILNLVVCFIINKTGLSKGLPMIIIVMFFKVKEITFKIKIAIIQMMKEYYTNPHLEFFRRRVISAFLPGPAEPPSRVDPDDNQSMMSFKSFKAVSEEEHHFEHSDNNLLSKSGDTISKALDVDDSGELDSDEDQIDPSGLTQSRFATFFIPQMHLILAENWKDGQSIVESMHQNSTTFYEHLPNFCDKNMQISFVTSLLDQLKSRVFLYNLSFWAKTSLFWSVLKNNYGFINFCALACLNVFFIFFSEMPIGLFAFLVFCFLSLTFCSADDLGLTFKIGKYFFLPVLYALNLFMLLQLAILNDSILEPLSVLIQPSNYLPESLKIKSFLLLILWRFHIHFMSIPINYQKKGVLFLDTKYIFDFLKGLRPPSFFMKVIYVFLKCLILMLIFFLSLNHISLIVSRNCLFRLGFLVGIFYFCYKQTLTLKILLRSLIVTSNCILGLSLLYCFLQPDILTLRQERFLGMIFELPVGNITFASLELHIFLVKNFLLRLSYFVFVRWEAESTLRAPMQFLKDYLVRKRSFLLDFYFRFQMIGLLLGYMYVTLRQKSETFIIAHLNLCLILLAILIYQLVKKKRLSDFYGLSTSVFKIFIFTHVLSIIFEFVIQMILLTNLDRDDVYMHNSAFSKWIPALIRKEFIENEMQREENDWGSIHGKYEAIKNLMLILIGFSNSFMKDIVPFVRGTKTDYQRTLIFLYIFYFILFCVNIHYFIFFTMKTKYFDYVTGIFIFFFFVSINYMIFKFYKIGTKFKFKQIVKQKLRLYKASFLDLDPLRDSQSQTAQSRQQAAPSDLESPPQQPPAPKAPDAGYHEEHDSLSSNSLDFSHNQTCIEQLSDKSDSHDMSKFSGPSMGNMGQREIKIAPQNEHLFFEKVEFLGELYKAKFLSQIKEILMDFFLRFLIFYLIMFTVYFFSKNHYLLLIEQEFEKTRLLIEVFILFLSSFNLYLINNVSSKIDSEEQSDNSRFSSQIKYLVDLLIDVNSHLLRRFKDLKRRNKHNAQRVSASSGISFLDAKHVRESKLSLSSDHDRSAQHNFFRKTSLNLSERLSKDPLVRPPNQNFLGESREFQNRLNELVVKHLLVFLRLNPELPLDTEVLEHLLGFESISHLERREFTRQIEDHAQEKQMKERLLHNKEVAEYFFSNCDEFPRAPRKDSERRRSREFEVSELHRARMEYPNELFEASEKKAESTPVSPNNKSTENPWLLYFKEPTSKDESKSEHENEYVSIKNRRDMSLEEKLLFYQMNKHNYFAAIFFFSLYDVLKDSIVNIILLFLLNNVNGLTLICILVMFGCRFIYKTHFNDMVFFLSCVFCARLFAFLFSDEFPENPFASFFILANKNKTFLVCEAFIIGSSIFILIPTMFLVKIVFEDFRVLRVEKNKKFFRIFSIKSNEIETENSRRKSEQTDSADPRPENPFISLPKPTGDDPTAWRSIFKGNKKIYLNYNLWRSMPASLTIMVRNTLITKGHYLFPLSLFLLSLFWSDYLLFFKLYIVYDCFFKFFLKKNARESKRINRYLNIGFTAAQLSVLFYIIYSVLYLMIKRRQNINQIIVNIFVLVNFKIILENCLFIKKDKVRVKDYNNTLHETQNLLNRLSKNEDFLLQKMDRLLNYDRILYFRKYGDLKERSLNEYVMNNLLYFQRSSKMNLRRWVQYLVTKTTLKIFQRLPRFNGQNILFLALAIRERFMHIFPDMELNILGLLTDDPECLRSFFNNLKELKLKMQENECSIVKSFYRNLNQLRVKNSSKMREIQKVFEKVDYDTVSADEMHQHRRAIARDRTSRMDVRETKRQVILRQLEDRLTALQLDEHKSTVENLSQKTQEFGLPMKPSTKVLINGFRYEYLYDPQTLELRFSILALLRVLRIYFMSKVDVVLELVVLVLAIITMGVSCFLFLGFFLFFFVLENLQKFKYKLGVFVYLIFILNLLIKPLVVSSPVLVYLFGPRENNLDSLAVFLLTLLLSTINRRINKRFVSSVELFTESVLRVSLNNCFTRLPWRFNLDIKQLFRCIFAHIRVDGPDSVAGLPIKKMCLFFGEYEEFSKKLTGLWPKLFINLKLLNKPKEHRKYRSSFWFRNFSQYNIKSFSSYFWLKVCLLFLFLIFNVDYFILYKRNVQNLEEISATSGSIDSMLVLNISLSFLFFLVELIFSKYQTSNINSIYKIPALNESPVESEPHEGAPSPLDRFRRAVSRLIIVSRFLRPCTRNYRSKEHKQYQAHHSLIFLKYLLNIGLWCYLCFIRFIWIPSYDENAFRHSFDQITIYRESFKLKMIAIWLTLYLYFDLVKLTGHRFTDIQSILNIDFKSILKKIYFKVYMAIPFLLEFKTVILFVCSKTSLDILKWFKIEDIKALLMNAKFYVESEKRKTVGEKENFLMKTIMFVSFFVPFFAMVVIPFIFFSDLNPLKQAQIVTDASLEIGIADSSASFSEKNFIRLVMIDLIPENENKDKLAGPTGLYSQVDHSDEGLSHLSLSNCTKLKSYIASKKIFNYNDILFRQTLDTFSKVHYKLNISTAFHNYSYFNEVRNNNFDYKNFREFLQESCAERPADSDAQAGTDSSAKDEGAQGESELYNYLYLGEISMTFETTDEGEINQEFMGFQRTKLYLKRNCRNGMKYFGIQKNENVEITFFVKLNDIGGEYILKNMQQESSSTFLGMYLFILVFVGMTLIRKNLLNKSDSLWTENIPKANRILKIIDFIELRRKEFNFKEEEIYYYILLDVFRSTEDIIKKSGTLVEMNYKNYLKQKQRFALN